MLILEPAFLLMYYAGFSWLETSSMPVAYKRWFIERISKELQRGSENGENPPTKALHQNTPDVRALQGQARDRVPSRLRRFT